MEYRIIGTTMPALEITLERREAVFTETTSMSWMSREIDMATGTRGGLLKMAARAVTGESLFLTTFRSEKDGAKVVFTPDAPGQIIPMQLADGESIIAQRDAFMAATEDVDVKVAFRRRLGAGFFGGEGFIMQRLTGPGTAFAEIGGEVVEYNLERGEVLQVNPGYVAMHEPSVDYDITLVRGVRNWLFGGEGFFMATLKGPGKVWLQTMPVANLAAAVQRYLPTPTAPPVPPQQQSKKEEKE
ncbi:MAG: TIGR00266 family protein [Chloroflexota bacterium]